MKLLESTESLLDAGHQNQVRSERLGRDISSHRAKIQELQEDIAEAKGRLDQVTRWGRETKHNRKIFITELEDEAGSATPIPPPLPPPPRPALPVSSKEQQRNKTIEELVATERHFHHQMELCCTKVLSALREVRRCHEHVV